VTALVRRMREVRSAAAAAVCHRPGGVAAALAILGEGSNVEQETALEALIGHEEAARSGLIDWADREVIHAAALRRGSFVLAQAPSTSVAAYLGDVLGRRAEAIVARSSGFAGTYGVLPYLASLHGVPSVALYSEPAHVAEDHVALATSFFAWAPFGRFTALEADATAAARAAELLAEARASVPA